MAWVFHSMTSRGFGGIDGDALAADGRLTDIERELNLLLVLPHNGAEAWMDFKRSGYESVPTLQSRSLDFDPDVVKRDLYNVEIERVEDSALNTLFRAKRDEIARQIPCWRIAVRRASGTARSSCLEYLGHH